MTKRIAVLAVYLEREKGLNRFALRDITDAFKAAKEPKLPAHSQYARAVAMDYLAKDGDSYYATTQAEKLIKEFHSRPVDEDEGDED
jgi:hypothetical protein